MNIIFNDTKKNILCSKLMEMYNASNFYGSKPKFAQSVGLSAADMTNIEHNKWVSNRVLIGEQKWVRISRIVGYHPEGTFVWKSAETYVKEFIYNQLDACKNESLTAMLVDDAGIGKTFSAKLYAGETKGVFYIDCSVANRKSDFIRALGKAVGIGAEGRMDDILRDAIHALSLMDKPLLILDEAGDLDNKSILIIKQIYNALEGLCGIYAIGADGLKKKIERGIQNSRLGYVEVFSRFGKKFGKCLPAALDERKATLKEMAEAIVRANGITKNEEVKYIVSQLFVEGLHDMRKIKREIIKKLKIRN